MIATADQILHTLSKIPIFCHLPADSLELLLKHAETVVFKIDEVVFQEGDIGDAIFVILKGSVRILATSREGHEVILASLEENSYFGEQAMLPGNEDNLRNATVVATDLSELLRITRTEFQTVLRKHDVLVEMLHDVGKQQIHNRLMRQSGVFRSLPLSFDSKWLEKKSYADGETVYCEGDRGEHFYLITEGIAQVIQNDSNTGKANLLKRLGVGGYFGELALIDNVPRTATIQAEGTLQVLRLSGECFLEMYRQTPALRDYMKHFRGFYNLSHIGMVITQHASSLMDMDSVTTIYHSSNGIGFTTNKVVDQPIFSMSQVGMTETNCKVLRYEQSAKGLSRELYLNQGRIVGITAIGTWLDLGRVHNLVFNQSRLWPWQKALFLQQGELWLDRDHPDFRDNTIVCHCVGVTRGTLNRAVAEGYDTVQKLAQKTGASTVCGACAPVLAEIVGASDLEPAILVGIIPVNERVKSFRFKPKNATIQPHLPGQHIRVEAKIEGRWIQRSYTLTSSSDQREFYEITVQIENQGLFSTWLHQHITQTNEIRLSAPQGRFHVDTNQSSPVICFCGGIGITPALAIARTFDKTASPRPLYIDYSAPTRKNFAYAEELQAIADRTETIRINLRATDERGRLSTEAVTKVVQKYPNADYYLCGPKPFEQAAHKHLITAQITDDKIHIEHFAPPSGNKPVNSHLHGAKLLLTASITTLILSLAFLLIGPIPPTNSVHIPLQWDSLWTNSISRQISGFTILILAILGMAISLRKRCRKISFLNYAWWRIFHIITALFATAVLFVHTGLALGSGFNFLLLTTFLGLVIVGATTGILTFLDNYLPHQITQRAKGWLTYLHIAFSWPLPVLLLIHIISVYYY